MKVLISHAVEDEPAAAAIKELIQRCSMGRISVWYSSDQSSQGGMPIGGPWFVELQAKLKATEWVVALATPASIRSPWLYFECGFAAASREHSVIPMVLGMPISELPMPLAAYQSYDGSNAASLLSFTQKLLAADNLPFDEEMTRPVRDGVQRRLVEHTTQERQAIDTSGQSMIDTSDLKSFIEQRFKQLYDLIPEDRRPEINLELRVDATGVTKKKESFTLNIPGGSSFGDVLNEIYFRISDHVEPFTFLFQWTIVDTKTDTPVSLETLKHIVPASIVFKSDRVYSLKIIDEPEDYLLSQDLIKKSIPSKLKKR